MFAPFVPFIVLFCHVMETRDQADAARLDAFVRSIQAATTVSEHAAKMHRLFQVLESIARRYVEINTVNGHASSSASAMDASLAALGFPRAVHSGTHTAAELGSTGNDQYTLDPMIWMGDNASLEEWLYTNQESMEMLQGTDMNFPWTE